MLEEIRSANFDRVVHEYFEALGDRTFPVVKECTSNQQRLNI